MSDLEVSGNGEWAAFSSPEDSNTYVIDGPNRIKSLLMEGWSYNITWLPAVAESY